MSLDEDFKRWTRRVVPHPGDLLFSYETRLGEAALMPEGIQACLGRRMALLRPNRVSYRAKIPPLSLLESFLSVHHCEAHNSRCDGHTNGLSNHAELECRCFRRCRSSRRSQRCWERSTIRLPLMIGSVVPPTNSRRPFLLASASTLAWGTPKDIATINAAVTRPVANGSLRYVDICVGLGRQL